jgi:hypothetical protein
VPLILPASYSHSSDVAILARTDPNAQENVVAHPDLDDALAVAMAGRAAEPLGLADPTGY